jgi:hypothetical protein
MPKLSSADAALRAAKALIDALKHPSPAAPFAKLGTNQLAALEQLADIFHDTADPPVAAAPSPRVVIPPSVLPPPLPPARTAPPPRVTPGPTAAPSRRTPGPTPATPRPHLIAPDPDDPILHRYPLRSQVHGACQNRYSLATQHLVAAEQARQVVACSVTDEITGQALEYRHLVKGPDHAVWRQALANDLGRLAQGVGTHMPTGTDTIFFIARHRIPLGRKVTYGRLVASIRPTKEETHRVRVTVGGDRLDYPGVTTTQCASLTTTKCLLNSTLSTPDARFMVLDIKDFYYGTPMARFEYMKLPIALIPDEIIAHYHLRDIAHEGYVYLEVRKGMPGLKQAGKIANDRLTKHLATFGYAPVARTPSLWKHATLPIMFSLVVDDFGVKYSGTAAANHLIHALRQMYQITVDWEGSQYLGLQLRWDYVKRTVDLSMPGYIAAALHRFQHSAPTQTQDAPHSWTKPTYGAKVQYADDPDDAPRLPAPTVTFVQQVVGTLLYYSLAVDPTMLVALGSIAAAQSTATAATYAATVWLLNYAASHPDATIRYVASDMILHIHSDASYLSEKKARSRAGGHYFLSSLSPSPLAPPTTAPAPNGPLFTISRIMRNVMGSAAEAEIGATYINGQEAIPIRTTLTEMGHPQPPTPMQVDNSTAEGFANDTIKQKRSKAIDMRFYWIKDRTRQGQFLVYWRPGSQNLGDYQTKHHPASHHLVMRPTFLHNTAQVAHLVVALLLRGCVKSRGLVTPESPALTYQNERMPMPLLSGCV